MAVTIVAYEAERTIVSVLDRIPAAVWAKADRVCVFDDASLDGTWSVLQEYAAQARRPNLEIFRNPRNLGYGGNQKVAYRHAMRAGCDVAVLLHGDGQYAPELLERIAAPVARGEAEVVLGSRMLHPRDALQGGMPLYKFVGNRILTFLANEALGRRLSEYHTGYRAYDLRTLARIPFHRNTDDFHFDTQILVQLHEIGARFLEVPIPTYYGDEECHVAGLPYAWNVLASVAAYKLHTLGLDHRPEYDIPAPGPVARTGAWELGHRILAHLPADGPVLQVGAGLGELTRAMAARGLRVHLVDPDPPRAATQAAAAHIRAAIDSPGAWNLPKGAYQAAVLPDVLEHLREPEGYLRQIRGLLDPKGLLLAGAGNVAFWPIRLAVLAGQFSYTPRGILDTTHVRLFTRKTLERLVSDAGFELLETDSAALPLEEVLPRLDGSPAAALRGLNQLLGRLRPGLFAYQFLVAPRARPDPLDALERASLAPSNSGG